MQAKPFPFLFEKLFFRFFFVLQKFSFCLCIWIIFVIIFYWFVKKSQTLSWFWQNSWSVTDPILLVNPNNSQVCIFIVKKCHIPFVFYGFSSFQFKLSLLKFTFSCENFIWNFGKYHFHCDFDSLFQIFLKTFIFHLICKYIFFT